MFGPPRSKHVSGGFGHGGRSRAPDATRPGGPATVLLAIAATTMTVVGAAYLPARTVLSPGAAVGWAGALALAGILVYTRGHERSMLGSRWASSLPGCNYIVVISSTATPGLALRHRQSKTVRLLLAALRSRYCSPDERCRVRRRSRS